MIAVLHQPSYQVFEMFDDVIFLARGGSSVYVGAAKDASSFFTDYCGVSGRPSSTRPTSSWTSSQASTAAIRSCRRTSCGSGKSTRKSPASKPPARNTTAVSTGEEEPDHHPLTLPPLPLPPLTPGKLSARTLVAVAPVGFDSLGVFVHRALTQQLRASMQVVADLALEAFAGILVGSLYSHVANEDLAKFLSFASRPLSDDQHRVPPRLRRRARRLLARGGARQRHEPRQARVLRGQEPRELPRLGALAAFFVLSFYPIVTPNVDVGLFFLYACAAAFASSGAGYLASVAFNLLKAQLYTVIYVLVALMFSGLAPLAPSPATPLLGRSRGPARWFAELLPAARLVAEHRRAHAARLRSHASRYSALATPSASTTRP